VDRGGPWLAGSGRSGNRTIIGNKKYPGSRENMFTVKPLDAELVGGRGKKTGAIVTAGVTGWINLSLMLRR
jgi:hypothetical protein